MIPKTLNLSMEDYLDLVDRDIERGLTGFVSEGNRVSLWETIYAEEDRVARCTRQFPSEFRIILRPQVAFRPCTGPYLCNKVKVHGKAELAMIEQERKNWVKNFYKSSMFPGGQIK